MDDMPEEIWVSVYESVAVCRPKGYWPNGRWPAVFKQRRDRATKYTRADTERLKVMEDALRECSVYFEDRMDADYQGEETGYMPNEEMTMYGEIEQALAHKGD